jgi:hypothetical protein
VSKNLVKNLKNNFNHSHIRFMYTCFMYIIFDFYLFQDPVSTSGLDLCWHPPYTSGSEIIGYQVQQSRMSIDPNDDLTDFNTVTGWTNIHIGQPALNPIFDSNLDPKDSDLDPNIDEESSVNNVVFEDVDLVKECRCHVPYLVCGTDYVFRVRCVNLVGWSPWTNSSCTYRTGKCLPFLNK